MHLAIISKYCCLLLKSVRYLALVIFCEQYILGYLTFPAHFNSEFWSLKITSEPSGNNSQRTSNVTVLFPNNLSNFCLIGSYSSSRNSSRLSRCRTSRRISSTSMVACVLELVCIWDPTALTIDSWFRQKVFFPIEHLFSIRQSILSSL